MRIAITVIRDVKGNFHVPYVGEDAHKAVEALHNCKIKGAKEGEVYRFPERFRRHVFTANETEEKQQ